MERLTPVVETRRRRSKMTKPKNNKRRPLMHPATMKGYRKTGSTKSSSRKHWVVTRGNGVLLLINSSIATEKMITKLYFQMKAELACNLIFM